MLATWDNHDYGDYERGHDFPLKQVSKELFLDFWGEPSGTTRRATPGIYDAVILGSAGRRVQIILLDTRWFKSSALPDLRPPEFKASAGVIGRFRPNPSSDVTLLGSEQWTWLQAQLRKPAELRLIVSGGQIVADEKGMDEWGNFPAERARLLKLIRSTHAEGVLLLTGNVHFAELSLLASFDYPLYDFTASGMTDENIEPRYAGARNQYRVAGPHVAVNFGLISIDWDRPNGPMISLESRGLDGKAEFSESVALRDLRFPD